MSTHLTGSPDECRDRVWLADTLTRASLRYGRALHALSMVPGPLALARLWDLPEAGDVQKAAETIFDHVQAAMRELDGLARYVEAITDPGPATCAECGARADVFMGREGFEHWRYVSDTASWSGRRVETFDAGHEPRPVWNDPPRLDWREADTDLTPDTPTTSRPEGPTS